MSRLKTADDKISVNQKFESYFERVENLVRKVENAGYQHFLIFPKCSQKFSFSRSLKVGNLFLTLYSIDTHFKASTTDSL